MTKNAHTGLVYAFPRQSQAPPSPLYVCVRSSGDDGGADNTWPTMCEHVFRAKPSTAPVLDFEGWWTRRDINYLTRHGLCTVLGSSAMVDAYDYSSFLRASDMVFVINAPPKFDVGAPYKVTRAFGHIGNSDARHEHESQIFMHHAPFKMPPNVKGNVTDPALYGLAEVKKLCRYLHVPFPGKYVSGIGVTMWAKHVCDRVQLVGFYGFDAYEHGFMNYTNDIRHAQPGRSLERAHLPFMYVFLALHAHGQVDLII